MKTFTRDCFNCGTMMTLVPNRAGLAPMVECRACEVTEDATMTGRFAVSLPAMARWVGEFVPFTDHGAEYSPTP